MLGFFNKFVKIQITDNLKIINICGIKIKTKIKQKVIAVLRLDGLGDGILSHDFLKYIKQSDKFKNFKLLYISWNSNLSLFQSTDSQYVDEFIGIDSFNWNKKWHLKYLKRKFGKYNIDTLVLPQSRDLKIQETVLKYIPAKNVIGHIGASNNICNKKLYTNFIKTTDNHVFEFERIREFFEKLLDLQIDIKEPTLEYKFDTSQKYIFLSPFAGDPKRTWAKENWIELINYLTENYEYKCAIIGGRHNFQESSDIISKCQQPNKILNLAGEIPLCFLPNILKTSCQLLIANETGTVHVAKAVNAPFLVISNGSFYKNFQPYKGFEQSYIYPDEFEKKLANGANMDEYYEQNGMDINNISFYNLKSRLDKILKEFYFAKI